MTIAWHDKAGYASAEISGSAITMAEASSRFYGKPQSMKLTMGEGCEPVYLPFHTIITLLQDKKLVAKRGAGGNLYVQEIV